MDQTAPDPKTTMTSTQFVAGLKPLSTSLSGTSPVSSGQESWGQEHHAAAIVTYVQTNLPQVVDDAPAAAVPPNRVNLRDALTLSNQFSGPADARRVYESVTAGARGAADQTAPAAKA